MCCFSREVSAFPSARPRFFVGTTARGGKLVAELLENLWKVSEGETLVAVVLTLTQPSSAPRSSGSRARRIDYRPSRYRPQKPPGRLGAASALQSHPHNEDDK